MDGAVERYAAATEMACLLVDAWHDLGCPVMESGGVGGMSLIAHPLIKAISDAQITAGKLADAAGLGAPKVGRGRPVAAVSAPDRVAEPPRVKRVKQPPATVVDLARWARAAKDKD
jgi:hypothetical protein